MNSKGQYAIEFLITYGWALVAIVILISILFAFGILNPERYQANHCLGFSKMAYADHSAEDDGDFFITLRNGSGANIPSGSATLAVDCDLDGGFDASTSTASIWGASDEYSFTVSSACSDEFAEGTSYLIKARLVFTPSGQFKKTERAVCNGIPNEA